jgi:Protein of unknown function (DUF1838)
MKLKTIFATALLASLSAGAIAAKEKPRMLDPGNPGDALEISKRAQCGEADGKPAVYHWAGNIYSRVQGEPDRLLFKGEGMNIRQCVTVNDPQRGKGWRLVSREIMLYLDTKTGEVVRKWTNPWTDEVVDVMHIANDPVNQRPQFAISADGKPYSFTGRREGRWIFAPFEAPLFYHNVLQGDYQDYVGGKYHAMEIFDFAYDAEEILNTKNPTAYPIISWVRISDWMPWMKMRGRQGQMVFNAMGNKLKSYDELPKVLKDEIALNYPDYAAPPPGDDARPNETTWTVFKKIVDAERAKSGEKPKTGH